MFMYFSLVTLPLYANIQSRDDINMFASLTYDLSRFVIIIVYHNFPICAYYTTMDYQGEMGKCI